MSQNAILEPTSTAPARRKPIPLSGIARRDPVPAPPRALPPGTTPRGFALYVGFDENAPSADGLTLETLVDALRRTIADLAPQAQTHAAIAIAPEGVGGRDVDVVRLALHEPAAVARNRPEPARAPGEADDRGVVVDISRKRVLVDGESAAFTYTEFELLQYLVLREGRTTTREELVSSVWNADDEDAPGERTVDVHIRRLRAKLGDHGDIVRTVRGAGYRFDRHADVTILYGHGTPSPDRV